MGMSERTVYIKNLIALKDFCNNNGVFTLASNIEQSLNYAISSLKTDLKCDLLYEGEKIYSKADMVAILVELQLEIHEAETHRYDDPIDKAFNLGLHRGGGIIQQKINALKENKDGMER